MINIIRCYKTQLVEYLIYLVYFSQLLPMFPCKVICNDGEDVHFIYPFTYLAKKIYLLSNIIQIIK